MNWKISAQVIISTCVIMRLACFINRFRYKRLQSLEKTSVSYATDVWEESYSSSRLNLWNKK